MKLNKEWIRCLDIYALISRHETLQQWFNLSPDLVNIIGEYLKVDWRDIAMILKVAKKKSILDIHVPFYGQLKLHVSVRWVHLQVILVLCFRIPLKENSDDMRRYGPCIWQISSTGWFVEFKVPFKDLWTVLFDQVGTLECVEQLGNTFCTKAKFYSEIKRVLVAEAITLCSPKKIGPQRLLSVLKEKKFISVGCFLPEPVVLECVSSRNLNQVVIYTCGDGFFGDTWYVGAKHLYKGLFVQEELEFLDNIANHFPCAMKSLFYDEFRSAMLTYLNNYQPKSYFNENFNLHFCT
jgi:hypothetical protein